MNSTDFIGHSAPRTRVHNATTVTKLPQELKDLLKRAADEQGVDLSFINRTAFVEYLQRRGYISE